MGAVFAVFKGLIGFASAIGLIWLSIKLMGMIERGDPAWLVALYYAIF